MTQFFGDFGRETDEMGHIKDPAERYQQIMLRMYDLLADAGDYGYSSEACARLNEARLMFIDEFEQHHPGYGKAEQYGAERPLSTTSRRSPRFEVVPRRGGAASSDGAGAPSAARGHSG